MQVTEQTHTTQYEKIRAEGVVEWKLWKGKTNQGWRNKYHIFIVDIRLALNVPALGPRPVLSCILTS